MATQWVLEKISDALQPTVQNAVGTAGSFAGGAINTVGTSINGVGERINTSIRYYGDGAKDYGNSVMDWTKAPGSRAQTASNPLGLSKSAAGGKAAATSPSIYRAAPKSKPVSKVATTPDKSSTQSQNKKPPVKTQAGPKVVGAPAVKAVPSKKPALPPANLSVRTVPKKPISASKPAATNNTAPKSRNRSLPKPTKAAANPLGLTK